MRVGSPFSFSWVLAATTKRCITAGHTCHPGPGAASCPSVAAGQLPCRRAQSWRRRCRLPTYRPPASSESYGLRGETRRTETCTVPGALVKPNGILVGPGVETSRDSRCKIPAVPPRPECFPEKVKQRRHTCPSENLWPKASDRA
jgi:hypothetical protein